MYKSFNTIYIMVISGYTWAYTHTDQGPGEFLSTLVNDVRSTYLKPVA